MKIGYARVSTTDQHAGFEAQKRDLAAQGCTKVFEDKASGKNADRSGLKELLGFVREGDIVVVTKLDRLARSLRDFLAIVDDLKAKGAGLSVLDMPGFEPASPTGELVLNVIASIGQFERRIMLERQAEGIADAKAAKKYKGRAPTARAKTAEIVAAYKANPKPAEIAKALKIGRTSVYRALWAEGLLERPSAA